MTTSITATDGAQPTFTLRTPAFSYIIRVDETGQLITSHFGAPLSCPPPEENVDLGGWNRDQRRREFPAVGRGDMKLPAVHIQHASGHTVSHFTYASHKIVEGKPELVGQPHTFGSNDEVSTLVIELEDKKNNVAASLSYSVFSRGAIVRSAKIRNTGKEAIKLERIASFSVDLATAESDVEMVHHFGNWAREFQHVRRKIEHGNQG